MNRSAAQREIDKDDGDPSETVYTSSGSPRTHYHEDRNCDRLEDVNPDRIREVERKVAQRRVKPPCRLCTIDGDIHAEKKNTTQAAKLESLGIDTSELPVNGNHD